MMHETDFPCSDCGTTLVEQTIHPRDLPLATDGSDHVTIAICTDCGARYYPAETLSAIARSATGSPPS